MNNLINKLGTTFKNAGSWGKAAMISLPLDLANQVVQEYVGTNNQVLQTILDSGGSFFPVIVLSKFYDKFGPTLHKYSGPFVVTLGAIGLELNQKLGTFPGTFDEKDIVASVLGGIVSAYLCSREKSGSHAQENFEGSYTQISVDKTY